MKTLSVLKRFLAFSGVLGLVISFCIFFAPIAGAEGGVTVDCPNGGSVSCSGYRCTGTDNVGCSCKNANGQITDSQKCPKSGVEIILEETQN